MGKYTTCLHQKHFLTPLRLDFDPKVVVPFSLLFLSLSSSCCGLGAITVSIGGVPTWRLDLYHAPLGAEVGQLELGVNVLLGG